MSWIQSVLQKPWDLITDDRTGLILGTYFLFVSFPREVAEDNVIWSTLYLIGSLAIIIFAWRELGRGGGV